MLHIAQLLSLTDVLYNPALPHRAPLTHDLDTIYSALTRPCNTLAKPPVKRTLQCTNTLKMHRHFPQPQNGHSRLRLSPQSKFTGKHLEQNHNLLSHSVSGSPHTALTCSTTLRLTYTHRISSQPHIIPQINT